MYVCCHLLAFNNNNNNNHTTQGSRVEDLASKCNVEPGQLCTYTLFTLFRIKRLPTKLSTAQILRAVSSQGIFKEAAPDVFTNNRLSIVLDKGLSQNELDGNPTKFVTTCSYKSIQVLTTEQSRHSLQESPECHLCSFLSLVSYRILCKNQLSFYLKNG